MRKKVLLGIGAVAFAATLAFNASITGSNAQATMSLSNVEALARGDGSILYGSCDSWGVQYCTMEHTCVGSVPVYWP